MKQVIFSFSFILLFSMIMTSCEESQGFNSPMEVQSEITNKDLQSNAFANAPEESGIVIRGNVPIGLTWIAEGKRVFFDVDIIEICMRL